MVNCYVVIHQGSNAAIVVDPGGDVPAILEFLKSQKLQLTAIVNTHCHGDHVAGNDELRAATGAPVWIGYKDAEALTDPTLNMSAEYGLPVSCRPADRLLHEGDFVSIGDGALKVLETPGHTIGSISLAGDGFVLSGDLLFAGSVGRTDFYGGNFDVLIKSIHDKLYPLGEDCIVLPGHENLTTILKEKQSNPFLRYGNRRGW